MSCGRLSSDDAAPETGQGRPPDSAGMAPPSPVATDAKPKGAGMQFSAGNGRARRNRSRISASSSVTSHVGASGVSHGAISWTTASDLCTALTRRRSQRTAPGRPISRPRIASAATSILLADATPMAARSIADSRPGRRAARKSGNRLNVVRPCGQYQRAMRTPGLLRRA